MSGSHADRGDKNGNVTELLIRVQIMILDRIPDATLDLGMVRDSRGDFQRDSRFWSGL